MLYNSTPNDGAAIVDFSRLGIGRDWSAIPGPMPGAMIGAGLPASDFSICREVIVIKNDMAMQSCIFSQSAFADWKEGSTAAINAG